MRNLIDRTLLALTKALWGLMMRRRGSMRRVVGSRSMSTFLLDGVEYSVTRRKLTEPNHYSREELLTMLSTVRREEQRMHWKCPDPVAKTTAGGSPSVTFRRHREMVLGLARALNGVVAYAPKDRQEELNDVVLAAQLSVMEDNRG